MDFVTANRPVVIKGMAADWGAIENWKDSDVLAEKMGGAYMSMNRIGKMPNEHFTTYKMKP